MSFVTHYGLFLLESITIVIALLLLFVGLISIGRNPKPKLSIISLNEHYENLTDRMKKEIFKKKSKRKKKNKTIKPTVFVLDFAGDIKASQVDALRDEITAVLSIAGKDDEVCLRLESPGGSVNGYGLAAAQLQRLRDKNIPLTACIDTVAASGGYLMACVANKIIAAPFAIIGSIGVVAQLPNFHRLLNKNNIDVELLTAGEYKRTLTLFAENTEKGRKKFQEDIEQIHQTFKAHVLAHRPQLDMDAVATGEHWLAVDAFRLNLVDALKTSDEVLCSKMETFQLFSIKMHVKHSLFTKLLKPAIKLLHPWA